jgi:hypothetical protein
MAYNRVEYSDNGSETMGTPPMGACWAGIGVAGDLPEGVCALAMRPFGISAPQATCITGHEALVTLHYVDEEKQTYAELDDYFEGQLHYTDYSGLDDTDLQTASMATENAASQMCTRLAIGATTRVQPSIDAFQAPRAVAEDHKSAEACTSYAGSDGSDNINRRFVGNGAARAGVCNIVPMAPENSLSVLVLGGTGGKGGRGFQPATAPAAPPPALEKLSAQPGSLAAEGSKIKKSILRADGAEGVAPGFIGRRGLLPIGSAGSLRDLQGNLAGSGGMRASMVDEPGMSPEIPVQQELLQRRQIMGNISDAAGTSERGGSGGWLFPWCWSIGSLRTFAAANYAAIYWKCSWAAAAIWDRKSYFAERTWRKVFAASKPFGHRWIFG